MKGSKERSQEPSREYVLAAFNGKCYKCGKTGHRANKCPKAENASTSNSGGNGFSGKCNTCGKTGHKADRCWDDEKNAKTRPEWWKKKGETGLSATNNEESGQGSTEFLLMAVDKMEFTASAKILEDPNVFIGDTGASSDTSASELGFRNKRPAKTSDNIVDASGNNLTGRTVGDISGVFCDKYGNEQNNVVIQDVVHSPGSEFNLFSLTKRLDDGYILGGDKNSIWIKKGSHKIVFDIKIKTPKGAIFAAYFKRKVCEGDEVAVVATVKQKKINMTTAHGLVGHMNTVDGNRIVEYLGFVLKHKVMEPCEACAESKAKQMSLPKRTQIVRVEVKPRNVEKVANGKIYLDMSSVKKPKLLDISVNKPNWRLMVDKLTGMKWSEFYERKSDMVEPTCIQFNKWKQDGKPVGIVRCDNGGENKALETRCESADWKLGIVFEWTARNTPQQNSLVEVGFTTIGNRGRAMMIAANVAYALRFKLFREAYMCATLLDGLVVVEINGVSKTRQEHWGATLPKWSNALRTWGEAGVVTLKSKMTPKMANKGLSCMFVGYAPQHAEGVYRMWDPTTGRIHVTRDIVWLRRMYFQRQPAGVEITTGVDSVVRESGNEATPTVTPNEATPTVTPKSEVNQNVNASISSESDTGRNVSSETLDSHRQMNAPHRSRVGK